MKNPSVSCELWTINRALRYLGFRLYVQIDKAKSDAPTRIGFVWYGWDFLKDR